MNLMPVVRFILSEIPNCPIRVMVPRSRSSRQRFSVMSSAFLKFVLTNVLLVSQVLGTISVPSFGQSSKGQCCCSIEATQAGTCCCAGKSLDEGCCHSAESRSSGCSTSCQCGCRNDSRPTAPNPRRDNSRDKVQRLSAQPVSLSRLCPVGASTGPAFDSGRQPNAIYSGVPRQPLFCAWLL